MKNRSQIQKSQNQFLFSVAHRNETRNKITKFDNHEAFLAVGQEMLLRNLILLVKRHSPKKTRNQGQSIKCIVLLCSCIHGKEILATKTFESSDAERLTLSRHSGDRKMNMQLQQSTKLLYS